MKKSTFRLIKLHGLRIDRALHHYLYFRYYDVYVKYFYLIASAILPYISSFKITSGVLKSVYERFHARVLTEGEAVKILSLNENVVLDSDTSKKVVPFRYAYDVIFNNPGTIAVVDCPCRKAFLKDGGDINCCVCVGEGALFWLEQGQRLNARSVSQAKALEIIKDQRAKGCITTAWFKVATGGRTGVICSCHPDFCVGLKGMKMARNLKYSEGVTNHSPSGYTIRIDSLLCDNCGKCIISCHFTALSMTGGKMEYDISSCMGCSLCADVCKNDAITVIHDKNRPLALDDEIDKVIRNKGIAK
jgi:Pyruvate/2-oxoacid:ferredoxin oxidoreductase delta subunit